MNLKDVINEYLAEYKRKVSEAHYNHTRSTFTRIAIQYLHPKGILLGHPGRMMREHVIMDIYDMLIKDGLAVSTINCYLWMIRSFTKWTMERGFISDRELRIVMRINPLGMERYNIRASQQRRPMTEAEYNRILHHADKHDPMFVPIIRVGWETGLRFGDIVSLKVDEVMWEDCSICKIPHKTRSKKSAPVTIPISHVTLEMLRVLAGFAQDGYLFPDMAKDYGSMVTRYRLTSRVDRVIKGAGVRNATFHCMRHGFVSRLINKGVHPVTVASMTGQSISTIVRYANVSLDTKRAVLGLDNDYEDSFRRLCSAPVIPGGQGVPQESPALQETLSNLALLRSRLSGNSASKILAGETQEDRSQVGA